MSTVHGADPDRLDLLRRVMHDAVDDLCWLQRSARHLDDRVARSAAAVIEQVRSLLGERWLPLLGDVAHWCRLGSLRPDRWVDGTSPALDGSDAEAVVVEVQRWSIERLVVVWQLVERPRDRALLTRLDAIDTHLAGAAGRLLHAAHRTAAGAVDDQLGRTLDSLDPYAAALLLGHLGFVGVQLAAHAERILRRAHAAPPATDGRSVWTDRALAGPDAGDLVAQAVADDPHAARELLVRTAATPALVLEATTSVGPLAALLRVGLDPAVLDTAAAGTVVPAFTRATYVDATAARAAIDPTRASARQALAPSLAPWLLQFGPCAEDWNWSPAAADHVLQAVLADLHGARAMQDAVWHWVGRAAELASSPDGIRFAALSDIAAALEQLRLGRYDVELSSAVRDQFVLDGILDAGQALVGLAPLPGGFVLSRVAGYGVELQRRHLEDDLRRAGIVGRHPDEVAADLSAATDRDRATTLLGVLTTTVDRLLGHGRISPSAAADLLRPIPDDAPPGCVAATVREVLLARLDDLDARLDGSTRATLSTVVLSFSADVGDRRRC